MRPRCLASEYLKANRWFSCPGAARPATGWCLLLLLAALLPGRALAQARLNLALEAAANHRHPLLLWTRDRTPATALTFDTVVFREGRSSLRVDLPREEDEPYLQLYTLFSFPVDSVRDQQVTVTAWVRTAGFTGQAGIYAYAHTPDEDGRNRADNVEPLPPDMPWRRVAVTLPVKAAATAFGLGLRVSGQGTVWFDDVQVSSPGHSFRDAPQAGTEALLLTADELLQSDWTFEALPPAAARPDPARVQISLDSVQPQQGRRSLRVAATGPAAAHGLAPSVYLGTLPAEKLRGKILTVKGFWKQVAALDGTPHEPAAFTYTLLGNDGRPGSPPQWSRGTVALPTPAPTPAWTSFALDVPVPNDEFLSNLSLGLRPGDASPVLLDNLHFVLNSQPFVPAPPPTVAAPAAPEIRWLRQAVVPLTVTPPSTAGPDLAVLRPVIGPARVVGLGEVTHGSGSIFQLKHRLVRYLVEQLGFTVLVLETSADCAPLNEYLRTGQGSPEALLASLGVWNTQEVLDLLRSLRAYNQHHAGQVRLAGMDMQRPDLALAHLRQATAAADSFARPRLRALAAVLGQLPQTGSGAAFDPFGQPSLPDDFQLQQLLRLTSELRNGLDTRAKLVRHTGLSTTEQADFLYHLRLLEQGAVFRRLPLARGGDYRDACMAENVTWLQHHLGGGGALPKLIIWAHNAHIAKAAEGQRPLGEWLKASLGPGYLALGFAFGQGTYGAEKGGRFSATQAQPARAGTYEAWFQMAGLPAFVLDMRPLKPGGDGTWLFQQHLFRDIGIREAPRNFTMHTLPKEFDAVLFLANSVAARHLR